MHAHDRTGRLLPILALFIGLSTLVAFRPTAAFDADPERPGRQVYLDACAACHGADGRGRPQTQVGFEVPLPDFTDCNFATREPDADWVGVAVEGGPTRGFAHTMPAFGDALSTEELESAVEYIRGFCGDDGWPRGELNLPRAMFTEKAYPEDEAVWTVASPTDGTFGLDNEIVYEARFGSRSQWELVVPFSTFEAPAEEGGGVTAGFGDPAVGVKHALLHSFETGTILSVAGEVILPLGDGGDGLTKDVVVFEPFVSFGQILPAGLFLQLQAGSELPWDPDVAEREAFWRGGLGRSFTSGDYGRVWSPIVEVLGARALESGAETHWDVVPQLQVTLSTRQHIMGNVAVRVPIDDPSREPEVLVYLLWDWFDGGLTEGW